MNKSEVKTTRGLERLINMKCLRHSDTEYARASVRAWRCSGRVTSPWGGPPQRVFSLRVELPYAPWGTNARNQPSPDSCLCLLTPAPACTALHISVMASINIAKNIWCLCLQRLQKWQWDWEKIWLSGAQNTECFRVCIWKYLAKKKIDYD